jgi:LCP family protein required for cell wall assembly
MRRRSPLVAALLSAIVPGAGQAYQGRVGPALLFVAPLALLALGAGAALGVASLPQIAGWLLLPGVLTTMLVLDVALLAWRVAAVVDAWLAGRRMESARAARMAGATAAAVAGPTAAIAGAPGVAAEASSAVAAGVAGTPPSSGRRASAAVAIALVVILLAVTVPHVVAGVYVAAASSAVGLIFAEPDADPIANGNAAGLDASPAATLPGDAGAIAAASPTTAPTTVATPTPGETASPTPIPTPSPSPTATPWAKRLNVLLLGIDSGPGRNQALTDTMIVVSIDPIGRTVSMISVPRDTVNAPLGDGLVYQPKLNSLLSFAERNPGAFPGKKPVRVLKDTLGRMLGIPIQYYASVDLPGFIQVIDAIGGIGVYVKEPLYDGRYKEYGFRGFSIDAGCHHLDGKTALAYARIRYSVGQNDFTRAGRQQQVLVAARDRTVRAGLLLDVPALLDALGRTIRTDLPASLVPQVAELALGIDAGRISQAVVQPPLVAYGQNGFGSVLIPDLPAILAVASGLFPQPGLAPIGWPAPTAAATPIPGRTPTPTPVCR